MQELNLKNSEKGASFISVLVGLGLLGIGIVAVSRAMTSISATRALAAKSQASQGIENAMMNALAKKIRKGVKDANCGSGLAGVVGTQTISSEEAGTVRYQYSSKINTASWPASPPQNHVAARNNCERPYVDTQGKMYFCLEFSLNATGASDSFFDARYAFAEVAVVLTDIHTNTKVSCDFFAKNPTTSMTRIYYSLYYAKPLAGQDKFFKKNGMLFGVE